MQAKIHPKTTTVEVTCSNCSSKHTLTGAYYQKNFTVEMCSACHPAFTGVMSQNTKSDAIRGFQEKFKGFDFKGIV